MESSMCVAKMQAKPTGKQNEKINVHRKVAQELSYTRQDHDLNINL